MPVVMAFLKALTIFVSIFISTCLRGHVTSAQTYHEADAIFNDVIRNASTTVRPMVNQSDTLRVFVTFNLMAVTQVDEVRQELACNAWLNLSWTDELRTWLPEQYGGIKVVHPDPVDIWRARVMVSNSLQDRDIFKDAHAPVFLFSDGSTRWYPGGIFFTSCVMTVTVFPFDSHDCSLSFISIGFYAEELVFEPVNPEANLRGYSHNGEWELTSTSVSPLQIPVADETFSGFKVTLRLTRRPWFFLLNVVMPIMLLSLLNFMVFVLPNDCGEKVTFGTTILLSQAVYMSVVTNLLPQNSYDGMPLVLVYLFFVLVLCSVAVATSIVVVAFDKKLKCNDDKGLTPEADTVTNNLADIPQSESKDGLLRNRIHPVNSGPALDNVVQDEKPASDVKRAKAKVCLAKAARICCGSNALHLSVFLGLWSVMTALFLLHGVSVAA